MSFAAGWACPAGCGREAWWTRRRMGLASGRRCAASAGVGPEVDVRGVDRAHVDLVKSVVQGAVTATGRWGSYESDFLTPAEASDVRLALSREADVGCVEWGGYARAERVRFRCVNAGELEALGLGGVERSQWDVGDDGIEEAGAGAGAGWGGDGVGGDDEACPPTGAPEVAVVSVEGNFLFDEASHRDFLGAILSLGLDRGKVGDLLVLGEIGCQVVMTPEMAPFVAGALRSVRSVSVTCTVQDAAQLKVPPARTQEVRSVEASLRVDALASAGFRVSRGKACTAIEAGDVRVNWKVVKKKGTELKPGDVVSYAGKGRLELIDVTTTKRDRFAVYMIRYL